MPLHDQQAHTSLSTETCVGTKQCAATIQDAVACKNMDSTTTKPEPEAWSDTIRRLFGFYPEDIASVGGIVRLMNRPMDPSSLGATRFMFGFLMFWDAFMERGLHTADIRWGDPSQCAFPLFNWMQPMSLEWMYIVYLFILMGTIGLWLGHFYRLSCLCFLVPYWYIFLLDKQRWNNHSYLFGLLGVMFFFIDGNRAWSLDGLRRKKIRNAHVPLWNYALLRTQFFLVYFIASVKKLDPDWWMGFSQDHLSHHWAFQPFTYIMSDYYIDLLIVHIGGLLIDGSIGFLLFFDKTRFYGIMMGLTFNGMNSQIFSIGMFPYAMISTLPVFCHVDWPKKVIRRLPKIVQFCLMKTDAPQRSSHCYYSDDKQDIAASVDQKNKTSALRTKSKKAANKKIESCSSSTVKSTSVRHKLTTLAVFLYIMIQLFLPFSHFITQGYNNWTNGLYGYSWDMMVHHWKTQHIRITYIDKDTGEKGYLRPTTWSKSNRWSSHADMLKQYATCIEDRLVKYNITNIELKFDIWRSLNDRFQQRAFDPTVDILQAEWHPLRKADFVLPLLVDYSDFRARMSEVEKNIYEMEYTDVVFIADFPGMKLENYIQPELGNVSVTLWKGEIMIELVDRNHTNHTLHTEEKFMIPAGEYHNIHTISAEPACYMYVFENKTAREYIQNMTTYEQLVHAANVSNVFNVSTFADDDDDDDEDQHSSISASDGVQLQNQQSQTQNARAKKKSGVEKVQDILKKTALNLSDIVNASNGTLNISSKIQIDDPYLVEQYMTYKEKKESFEVKRNVTKTAVERLASFLYSRTEMLQRSMKMLYLAVRCIILGDDMVALLEHIKAGGSLYPEEDMEEIAREEAPPPSSQSSSSSRHVDL